MIDIELLKPGMDVWIEHKSRPVKLTMERLEKLISSSGVQYNVVDSSFIYGVPADKCYRSELECIEAQINYWRDMRLNFLVKHGLENVCLF